MAMPFFTPGDDPGASFPDLLRRIGLGDAEASSGTAAGAGLSVPHATTCVALRYADGVVMAGDRRATAGNLISHRAMEKVVQADRFSGVAIAGAAGPAMEMIKLFALQLEHYEKVEGSALSLEGKANQLSMMVRGNLPAAMQGMVVVPLFAGYDLRRQHGPAVELRRHRRPLRRARLRRHRLGQPARRHGHQGRLPRRPSIATRRSTWPAGRCGRPPTPTRPPAGPMRCAASTRWSPRSPIDGWQRRRRRRARQPVRGDRRRGACPMSMPFYVAPEQVMKDRADYARKGIARGRAMVAVRYDDGIALVAENPSNTLRKISEIYDRIAFAGVGKYNEFDQLRVAGVRAADLKGFQYSRDDVDARSLANQYAQILGQVFTHEMKPMEVEILVAEVGEPTAPPISCSTSCTTARSWTRAASACSAATPRRSPPGCSEIDVDQLTLDAAVSAATGALSGPDRQLKADDLEVAVLSTLERASLLPAAERRRGRRAARRLTSHGSVGTCSVDLNADVGEGFGRWSLGDDDGLMPIITSANVACGFHAGDPSTIRRTCASAVAHGVTIGAQVSYPDLAGFGRRFIEMEPAELTDAVLYQFGALEVMAHVAGGRVAYVKPHGALYNAIVHHESQAAAVVEALVLHGGELAVLGLPDSAIQRAADGRGVPFVAEGFADRGYRADGTLVPRGQPGASDHRSESAVAAQVHDLVARGVQVDLRPQRHPWRGQPGGHGSRHVASTSASARQPSSDEGSMTVR